MDSRVKRLIEAKKLGLGGNTPTPPIGDGNESIMRAVELDPQYEEDWTITVTTE